MESDFSIGFDDIDISQLPADARESSSKEFIKAVQAFVEHQFSSFKGKVQIRVDENERKVYVKWSESIDSPAPMAVVLNLIKQGESQSAINLLGIMVLQTPNDFTCHYNLGMLYSDTGKIEQAMSHLHIALTLRPDSTNAAIALAVAEIKSNFLDKAIQRLKAVDRMEGDNPLVLKNLGGAYLKVGNTLDAEVILSRAVALAPRDLQILYGLGSALEENNKLSEAGNVYSEILNLDSHGQVADLAREGRSRIAWKFFAAKSAGMERFDAVMYCLGAMERFSPMNIAEVQAIGFEIAVLGMKGLDINDSTKQYKLKSIEGQFSGLHLVSLMYVAFKKISPTADSGFDLSKEYASALALFKKPYP